MGATKWDLNFWRLGPILELAELDLDDAALQCYRDGVGSIVRAKFRQNLLHGPTAILRGPEQRAA